MVRTANACTVYCLFAILSGNSVTLGADETVTIEPQSEGFVVKIRGKEFTVLRHGPTLPKPYFWPVRSADGAILTRPIEPAEKDHPHHRGIWLSVDEVNDVKFWGEKGKITTREVNSDSGNPATIRLTNEWIGEDGKPSLMESTKISIYPNRLITYDFTLAPPAGKVARFDDTKEGFLGVRVAQSMRESQGGVVVNSDGKKTTKECWGQPAKWVDYTGPVDGKIYGFTLMDHPDNFRPSRYHVRDYGLFSLSPFGEGAYQNDKEKAKPVTLNDAMPSLRIRYGVYVHDGSATDGKVGAAYDQFLQTTTVAKSQ